MVRVRVRVAARVRVRCDSIRHGGIYTLYLGLSDAVRGKRTRTYETLNIKGTINAF